jgi:hypothetical protein
VGGANIFGVFRVKNHDFTPKNHIFSNFRGGRARVRKSFYKLGGTNINYIVRQNIFLCISLLSVSISSLSQILYGNE